MTDDLDGLFTPAEGPLKASTMDDDGRYGLTEDESRYIYPPPPGVAKPKPWRGWMRMTNLVGAFSDQKKLEEWLTWKAMMGLRQDDGLLFDEWMATPVETWPEDQQKKAANAHAELARERAGSKNAARRGTARHDMMDTYLSTGRKTGTRGMRMQLESALEAMDAHDLEPLDSEFKVWHPAAGGVMGTSDARVMCRRTGQIGILDWKTQARFWTWQEIAGQLYGYDSAPWCWSGPASAEGRWVGNYRHDLLGHPEGRYAGKRVALVAHMPQHPGPGQLPVTIHEVDLTYGQAVLECAARNVELRSIGRSEAVERRPAALRPVGLTPQL